MSNSVLEKSINPEFVIYLTHADEEKSDAVGRVSIARAEDKSIKRIESPIGSACAGKPLMIDAGKREKTCELINQSIGSIFGTKPQRVRGSFKDEL